MRPVQHWLRLAAFLVVLGALSGALAHAQGDKASNNKGKIEGTKWSSLPADIKGAKLPAGILKLEFAKDGKLVYRVGPMDYTGTYKLGAGDKVTLQLDKELAGRKDHEESVVIKGNRLTMTDSDGTSLTFELMK